MGRSSLSVLVLVAAAASINSQECMLNSFPTYDRGRTDYGRFAVGVQAVVPQYQFLCTGLVSELTARVDIDDEEGGTFDLQIWRPTGIDGLYTLLCGMQYPTTFQSSRVGNLVTFSPSFAVPVERGDVIGFYTGSVRTEPHQILYDPTAQGITVYSTSEVGEPLCNFSVCDDGVLSHANTAPLISATYESRMDIQAGQNRLGISDRCSTSSFSTCYVLSTTLGLGATQTPAPPLPTSTNEVGRPLCSFSVCDVSVPAHTSTAPLTSATYVTHPTTLSTASPGITVSTAAFAGIMTAGAVLVILMIAALLVLLTVRNRRYSPTAGDAIITEENEAYGARTQPEHIVTAANVAYGQVGGIPAVQDKASTPASVVDILSTQDKTYGSVSGEVVNSDTEGYVNTEDEYDYVNN